MNWLLRNLPLLAFLLVLAIMAFAGVSVLPLLARLPSMIGSELSFWPVFIVSLSGSLLVAIWLLSLALAYGVLVRFLAFFDDVAAIRRAYTKTSASSD